MENINIHTLREFFNGAFDIQGDVEIIEKYLNTIEEYSPQFLQEAVNMVKHEVQQEARGAIMTNSNQGGILAMATGSGKSRVPILELLDAKVGGRLLPTDKVLIVVPTEKLRDSGWKEEFEKWGALDIYEKCVITTCYASLNNFNGQEFKYVIGDEWHNMTEAKEGFFHFNTIHCFFGLTATPPRDRIKNELFKRLGIPVVYTLPLDIAVRLKLVAPCNITIVEVPLNNTDAVIQAGNAKNRFYQTEQQAYDYKDRLATQRPNLMTIMGRLTFLKNLDSITKAAKFILENLIPAETRTLIFTGTIQQSIELCENHYYSKPTPKKGDNKPKREKTQKQLDAYQGEAPLERFIAKEISRLSCVERLNEGANIPDIETMLATYINSNDKDFIQRLGRGTRFKIGHVGEMVVLVPIGTQAEVWVNKALASFDQSKIRRVKFENLLSGQEQLFIN